MESAKEIRKTKADDKGDCYLIKMPSEDQIGKQLKSVEFFGEEERSIYAIHPGKISRVNDNPHLRLIPNRMNEGKRLILL